MGVFQSVVSGNDHEIKQVITLDNYMIPNHLRPDEEQQKFIVKAINKLGYEPFGKPIHLYTLQEFYTIRWLYLQAKAV